MSYDMYDDEWKTVNFSISYNRLKNFNRNYQAKTFNGGSLTDYIARITTGYFLDDIKDLGYESDAPMLGVLAYNAWIINPESNNGNEVVYKSAFPDPELSQRLNVQESGGISSWDFSLGGNYADKFYWGATLSFTDISNSIKSWYDEDFPAADGGYTLYNELDCEGSGLQLAVGAIFKPTDALRLGISYHSPTWYSMTNYYYGSLDVGYTDDLGKNVSAYESTPDNGFASYRLQTPYSWTFSVASVINSRAILSLDYEIKDYRNMYLSNVDFTETGYGIDNDFIRQDYKTASTLRVGGEYRFTPQFSGRIGYAWMQNPYNKSFASAPIAYDFGGDEYKRLITGTVPHFTISGDTHNFTAGIGYRFTPQFYMDLAFVYWMQTDDLYYFPKFRTTDGTGNVPSNVIALKNNNFKGLLTVGLKF
jgi:long-subunit fatty acid transport protein